MKKKINHILPALVLTASLGLTTVSCNGFLDEMPDNRTELNTDQKIAKLLVSAYADVSPNELFELYSDNSDDSGPTYGYYKLSEQECYHWQDTKEECGISGHAQFSLGRLLQRNSRRQYGTRCHRRKRKSGVARPAEGRSARVPCLLPFHVGEYLLQRL